MDRRPSPGIEQQTDDIADRHKSRKALLRNAALNLAGYGAPMLVAIFAIPLLVDGLGTERFGVLTLAWMLIGYLGLFDLGLSRALTQLVAEKLGAGSKEDIPALIWTALLSLLALGIVVAAVLAFLLTWMIHGVLRIPPALQEESLTAFYLLAVSVPLVIVSLGLRGILEAYQRFDLTNMVRMPMGIYTFLAPLFVLPFTHRLPAIVAVLAFGRLLGCLAQLIFCLRIDPSLRAGFGFKRRVVGHLLRFGGWMSVSNIVSPLLVYLDRFFIGSLISITAVAYYAACSEVVTKLFLVSGAITGVLFPTFSMEFAKDRFRPAELYRRGTCYVFLAVIPLVLVMVVFAEDGLRIWLGDAFAVHSTFVLQILAVGALIHSVGQVPYAMIQGAGRPDLTALLHLVELPFYLLLLMSLIRAAGINGAAVAWAVRMVVDTACLFVLAHRLLTERNRPDASAEKSTFLGRLKAICTLRLS